MAVTKQTYTATGTWTAVQLADTFKQAFIDAGLMTDWFDSFLSGTVENRILRVINDGAKTYGTVYYWFMFTISGAVVATTSTWNATTHVPTGTQYVDYYATTTNSTANHRTILTVVNTTSTTITRYTSGSNSSVSMFLVRQGTSSAVFMLSHPAFNANALVDQNKMSFNNLLIPSANTASASVQISFNQGYHLRNSYLGSVALRTYTSVGGYTNGVPVYSYIQLGNVTGNYANTGGYVGVHLPIARTNTNPSLASDFMPIFTSPIVSPYMNALPNDFGLAPYYASTAMVPQDTLVVTAGVEEWEILVTAIATANTESAKLLFCVRTI